MSARATIILACSLLAAPCMLTFTGCITQEGPNIGLLEFPIPVSPFHQQKFEEEYWAKKRYDRVPILGPLTAGGPDIGLDVPSDDECMVALEKARPISGGLPMLDEVMRNNVRIVKDKVSDYVDPPRVIPVAGPCQLHHVHFKVTVHFDEIRHIGWPIPRTLRNDEAVEVLYIDHDHFHMVGNVDPGVGSNY